MAGTRPSIISATADIGRHHRHAAGAALQYDERLRFRQPGQHDQVDAGQPFGHIDAPGELHGIADPQFSDQRLAIGGIIGVLVKRPNMAKRTSGISARTRAAALMKVLISLIGTTRPISATSGQAGSQARSISAKRSASMPLGMTRKRSCLGAPAVLGLVVDAIKSDDRIADVIAGPQSR